MQIIFIGTAPFAVPSLQRLSADPEHKILAVVTQPDRPHGRGGKEAASPIKHAAQELGLPLFQPEKVRAKDFIQTVRDHAPDVLVVAAFGQIIPQRMLDIPKHGGINVHGSLLPRWRGAAPIQYALMAGDSETGVTTMQMDAGLDTGDMLLQAAIPLTDEDDLTSVETKLAMIGAALLLDTLKRLESGDCPRIPQDESLVTLAPSLPPEIGALDWDRPARELHNLVRGVTPKPGAYALWQGKRIKILKTEVTEGVSLNPGKIENVNAHGITVDTGKDFLRLLTVQPESKGRMAADAWARGARVTTGQFFEKKPSSEI